MHNYVFHAYSYDADVAFEAYFLKFSRLDNK